MSGSDAAAPPKSPRHRTSQAALEFLTTYGWAILVVLAAITALSYFGVLSPDRFLPNKCTTTPGFGCTEAAAQANEVRFVLMNNLGVDAKAFRVRFPAGELRKYSPSQTVFCGDMGSDLSVPAPTNAFFEAGARGTPVFEGAYFVALPGATWRNGERAELVIGTSTWNPGPPPSQDPECAFSGRVSIQYII